MFLAIFVLFINCFCCAVLKVKASKYTTYTYAKIKEDQVVYLYKSITSTQVENALFSLPPTYFVLLLSNFSDSFYKVEYNNIIGYVLKQQVTPVNEKPKIPYLKNIIFRVYSSDGTKVFASPFNTSSLDAKVIETIEVLSPLTYYGEILGDEFISNRGFSWVYCKTPNNNLGYVYKGLCDNFTPISPNVEKVTIKTEVFLNDDDGYLYNLVDVTPGLKVLLVILIALPSLALIYLLFKPFKIQKLLNQNNKKINKNQNDKNNYNAKHIKNTRTLKNKTTCQLNTEKQKTPPTETFKKKIKDLKNKIFKKNKNTSNINSKNHTNHSKNANKNLYSKKFNREQNKTLNTIQKIIDDEPL